MTPDQMKHGRQRVGDRLMEMFEELYKDASLSEEQVLEGLRYHDISTEDYLDWVRDYKASLR